MSSLRQDLWPSDLDLRDGARAPVKDPILREQAALLGEKTDNVIEGQVVTEKNPMATGGEMGHYFNSKVPTLDNYTYTLFSASHGIDSLYPVQIAFNGRASAYTNEEEFVDGLRGIFASDKTKTVIASLKAQTES